MASSRFVLPWPLSPTMAMPSRGTWSCARARFRKSRNEMAWSTTGTVVSSSTAFGSVALTVAPLGGGVPGGRAMGCPVSSTRECGRALLEERARALCHVLRTGEQSEVIRLEVEALLERRLGSANDRLDARRESEWRIGEHLAQHRVCRRQQLARRDHAIDQADPK